MINKYKELHEQLLDLFVEYHNIYNKWNQKMSQEKTIVLRQKLRQMRLITTEMRVVARQLQIEDSKRKREKWNRE